MSVDAVVSGAVGGLVAAFVIAALTWTWRWYRRPILSASITPITTAWVDSRMAGVSFGVENRGRGMAVGVELEVTIPESLYPRHDDYSRPARMEYSEGGHRQMVFVAHRDDPLYPGAPQAILGVQLAYNEWEERPSGVIRLPVVVRASNAREWREAVRLQLP